jgi:hypothetical protein
MTRRKASVASPAAPVALLGDIRALIEASHQRAASAVNAELTLLFWRIGQRIHTEVLAGQRGRVRRGNPADPWPSSLPVTMGAGSGRRTCAGWSSSPPLSRRNQLSRHCRDN